MDNVEYVNDLFVSLDDPMNDNLNLVERILFYMIELEVGFTDVAFTKSELKEKQRKIAVRCIENEFEALSNAEYRKFLGDKSPLF